MGKTWIFTDTIGICVSDLLCVEKIQLKSSLWLNYVGSERSVNFETEEVRDGVFDHIRDLLVEKKDG